MNKILIDLATVQQALVTLENVNPSLVCEMAHHPKKDQHGVGQKCPLEIRHLETIAAIKEALAQPVQPEQEPTPWRDMVVVSLVREGIDKHKARELADHFVNFTLPPPLPVQEPVACRFCHSKKGCYTWLCYSCGEIDDVQQPSPLAAQRPWVGLTDEDWAKIEDMPDTFDQGVAWAQARLKERNHG